MMKVAVLDDYQNVAKDLADWSPVYECSQVRFFSDHIADQDELISRLRPFDAICLMRERTPLPRHTLLQLPNLKFINTTGLRTPNLDYSAAEEFGIKVSKAVGSSSGAPELTWSLILAAAKNIPTETAAFRDGAWQKTVGRDLFGSTLGIIGLGKTGKRVAAIGKAFGMDVIAWSKNLTAEEAASVGVRQVSLETLLSASDWVTLHLVLSDRSRGIIGTPELERMKQTAWLVNTSRGPLVDEAALVVALEKRQIAGAALDVYDVEPLPIDHKLRRLANVIATPHIGFVTEDTLRSFYVETVENLAAWLQRNPIRLA